MAKKKSTQSTTQPLINQDAQNATYGDPIPQNQVNMQYTQPQQQPPDPATYASAPQQGANPNYAMQQPNNVAQPTQNANTNSNPFVNVVKDENKAKEKKERNWVINAGNIAILASSLSIVVDVIHKLLRMILVAYSGLIIFLYIIAGVLSILALFASIKYGFKQKSITVDAYFTGISFITLILI